MNPAPKRRRPSAEPPPKGLLSVLVGNTPAARGELAGLLSRHHPEAITLSVSVQADATGPYPVVQRLTATGSSSAGHMAHVSSGATGDPSVILRQDLIALRRARKDVHIVLTLPQEVDVLPFLLDLWRSRIGADSLDDHYDSAPVLAAIDPAVLLRDVTDVRRTRRLWGDSGWSEPLTAAEAAVRQIEAVDTLVLAARDDSPARGGAVTLVRHLNTRAHVTTLRQPPTNSEALAGRRSPVLVREVWAGSLEPVTLLPSAPNTHPAVSSLVWRARRPLHPARLAEALGDVMLGVLRSRGHLWFANRPDSVVQWRSAGPHLDVREADRWLEESDTQAWKAASAQRRTLADWLWDDYYGERRNEIRFTGPGIDAERITRALDGALATDAELSLGPAAWSGWADPLFSRTEPDR
ncbi:GTP-binding protein [Streptomyces sp. NPDC085466]|uniref:GTP-binding protein n=1 Tax=Streptomyces sp. NPDC085466 TaxID=3365725 RepID=UPI0037D6E5D3